MRRFVITSYSIHYTKLYENGPAIKQNDRLYGATILDVTPTILALLGLPVGGDMDREHAALVQLLELGLEPVLV